MPGVDAKTYERAYARVVAYVRWRMRGQVWAESDLPQEIAGEALLASFDPARYPWKREKPLEHHAVNVARSLLSDRARKRKLRDDPTRAAAADAAMRRSALPADGPLRAQARDARRDERHRRLLERLGGTAREVYLLYLQDVFDVEQQAQILGKTRSAIYEARKRVAEVVREVPAEPESSPDLDCTTGDDDEDESYDDSDDYGGGGPDEEAAS